MREHKHDKVGIMSPSNITSPQLQQTEYVKK